MKGLRLSGLSVQPRRSVTVSPVGDGELLPAANEAPAARIASRTRIEIAMMTARRRPSPPFRRPVMPPPPVPRGVAPRAGRGPRRGVRARDGSRARRRRQGRASAYVVLSAARDYCGEAPHVQSIEGPDDGTCSARERDMTDVPQTRW